MANRQQDGSILEAEKTRLKPPPLYKVLLLNDDYTPMDFVVVVLQTVFAMSRDVITSYSIHYTKLYEPLEQRIPSQMRGDLPRQARLAGADRAFDDDVAALFERNNFV